MTCATCGLVAGESTLARKGTASDHGRMALPADPGGIAEHFAVVCGQG